ncbi:unnamed protein product [Arabidopsis arenosa]|uniref:Bulb-type lectin domain-containing protein n=1 Tax=Arabidopsis arenosa TaxID=38785 RepID=A0A8S1ZM15_ARAAE|nr:unnamed protein product [Arabidopsis arenosa]
MLMGFISLLLTIGQGYISNICIPKNIAASMHPCSTSEEARKYGKKDVPKEDGEDGENSRRKLLQLVDSLIPRRSLATKGYDKCAEKGKVAFVSAYGMHQLHIFIFVLAVCHVIYCIVTYALGKTKMRRWKRWEEETKTIEYQYSHDPERFRFARDTSFGRRHLNFWSKSTITLWIVCFFRQFFRSVTKVDYLTLRHGFIMAHLAPGSDARFDFRKYIQRSLEEDFKTIVEINPVIWFIAVLFLLTNTNGLNSYLWLPFIPFVVILIVGTKLQVIITKLGLRIQEKGDVVKGTPLVQPGDHFFWFGRPRFILFLIHLVLFTNAFQLAFFAWSTYEFGLKNCFHESRVDVIIRISIGLIVQILCSYVTLPLYALVTQMGSKMKPTVFNERVATALKSWHHTAKKQIKHGRTSESTTPFSSRPTTPTHGSSPIHLLRNAPHKRSRSVDESFANSISPRNSDFDSWDPESQHEAAETSNSNHRSRFGEEESEKKLVSLSSVELPPGPGQIRTQHEITITTESPLSIGQTLSSSNNVYELGFFSPNNSQSLYVGIWFKGIIPRVVVWVANRENPVTDSTANLAIGSNGSLLLFNGKHGVIWSIGETFASNGSRAELSDSGDLFVIDNASRRTLWQSFEHLGDTMLPYSSLMYNLATGEKRVLTSWKSYTDPSPGEFVGQITPQVPSQGFIMRGSKPYWRSGPWAKTRFTGLPLTDESYRNPFSLQQDANGSGYFSHLQRNYNRPFVVLTSEGSLKLTQHNGTDWVLNSEVPANSCDFYGICGPFGLCVMSIPPKCKCNKGSAEECYQSCLHNCSCLAVSYIHGIGCLMWSQELMDVVQFSAGGELLFIRLARSEMGGNSRKKTITASIVSLSLFVILGSFAFGFWRVKHNVSANISKVVSQGALRNDLKPEDIPDSRKRLEIDWPKRLNIIQGSFHELAKNQQVSGELGGGSIVQKATLSSSYLFSSTDKSSRPSESSDFSVNIRSSSPFNSAKSEATVKRSRPSFLDSHDISRAPETQYQHAEIKADLVTSSGSQLTWQ